MKVNLRIWLLFLACIFFLHDAAAQNIRGDTVYVNESSTVELIFKSRSEGKFLPNGDGSYNVKGGTNTSLLVMAARKGVKDQLLEVTDGKTRKHLFILSYKEALPAKRYDWSDLKKLKSHVEANKKKTSKALPEADNLYKLAMHSLNDEEAWGKVEASYQQLANSVDAKDGTLVNARLNESRKHKQRIRHDKYEKAMKEGQALAFAKKYAEAIKAYEEALEYTSEDSLALKNIGFTKQEWIKDLVKKGDEAVKLKDYVNAKNHYGIAWNMKPADTALRNRFNRIKKNADPLIYKIEREKGDQAYGVNDTAVARKAYDSALAVKPDDAYVKGQLKKLDNQAKYFSILDKANSLAATASSVEEIDIAIKEYEKASELLQNRSYPKEKIKELKIKKESIKKGQTAERRRN